MQNNFGTGTFKTSDGCVIAFTLRQASSPGAQRIVFVHSLALEGSVWDGVAARLADQAEVLTYDCRGHGHSGREPVPYTTELFARDLAELLDHVGWPAAAVAGCSMGGCVAQTFAGLYPARVSALGLVDTTSWYGEEAPQKWRERAATARTKGLAGMTEFQATRWFSDNFRSAHPDVVIATNKIFLANNVECYGATCIMLGDADLRHYLPSLHMPVAVIVGEEDFATPVIMSQRIHETIPGSTLKIIPAARHLAPVECPEEIASQLQLLLGRVGIEQTSAKP